VKPFVGQVQAPRGGVDVVRVPGEVGGHVGQFDPCRQQPPLRPFERVVGAGSGPHQVDHGIQQGEDRGALVPREHAGRVPGALAEVDGVPEHLEPATHLVLLPGARIHLLDPFEDVAQSLLPAFTVLQERFELLQSFAQGGTASPQFLVATDQGFDGRVSETVERFALLVAAAQAGLVGLSMEGDRGTEKSGQGADGNRDPADLGSRTSVLGDPADHEQFAVLLFGAQIVQCREQFLVSLGPEPTIHGGRDAGASAVET
jgi:hypothetical protein